MCSLPGDRVLRNAGGAQGNNYERWHYPAEHTARHDASNVSVPEPVRERLAHTGTAGSSPTRPFLAARDAPPTEAELSARTCPGLYTPPVPPRQAAEPSRGRRTLPRWRPLDHLTPRSLSTNVSTATWHGRHRVGGRVPRDRITGFSSPSRGIPETNQPAA